MRHFARHTTGAHLPAAHPLVSRYRLFRPRGHASAVTPVHIEIPCGAGAYDRCGQYQFTLKYHEELEPRVDVRQRQFALKYHVSMWTLHLPSSCVLGQLWQARFVPTWGLTRVSNTLPPGLGTVCRVIGRETKSQCTPNSGVCVGQSRFSW